MTTTENTRVKAADHVRDAITAELTNAQRKFAPMNSDHEGWAVLLEEYEETCDELDVIGSRLQGMWQSVRANDRGCTRIAAAGIAEGAARAAVEAIQTAAMAERFLADLPDEES